MGTYKTCDHHKSEKKGRRKKICLALLVFIFLIVLAVVIIWAVLQPKKPTFLLQDATIYSFNLSTPTQLTSIFQVTIRTHNPNDHISIYYDSLTTYATYHDQQITLNTRIPSTYQDTKGVTIWSPYLQGISVPVAPYIGMFITQDRSMGGVQLVIKMNGRVRFRVGAFISKTYHINVYCEASIAFGDSSAGEMVENNAVKYQLIHMCSVSV